MSNREPSCACPICAGQKLHWERAVHDDRFGYPGSFDVYACDVCGHRWLDWKPTEEELEQLYSTYYPRSSRSLDTFEPLQRKSGLRAWWQGRNAAAAFWVPRDVRVLDIGCGFGEGLAYHRERGCDVHGVEADHNVRRVADALGLDIHIGVFSASLYAAESFDYVVMDQVLEHAVDPVWMLEQVRTVLKPGGAAVVATPNARGFGARVFGARWIHWHAPYHLQYFSDESLTALARRCDFEVDRLSNVTNSEWLGYQWIHTLTAPPAGQPSPFWSPTAPRSLAHRATRAALRLGHRFGGDHLATRILDALALGDNYVAVLRRRP